MRLVVNVPNVPKGSKTCGKCKHLKLIGGWCSIYGLNIDPESFARLPICLAGEREKVDEWWVLVNARGQECSPRGNRERTLERLRVTSGVRFVHVVRYRRRAKS